MWWDVEKRRDIFRVPNHCIPAVMKTFSYVFLQKFIVLTFTLMSIIHFTYIKTIILMLFYTALFHFILQGFPAGIWTYNCSCVLTLRPVTCLNSLISSVPSVVELPRTLCVHGRVLFTSCPADVLSSFPRLWRGLGPPGQWWKALDRRLCLTADNGRGVSPVSTFLAVGFFSWMPFDRAKEIFFYA